MIFGLKRKKKSYRLSNAMRLTNQNQKPGSQGRCVQMCGARISPGGGDAPVETPQ
jgi:hypothetical protein